VEAICLFFLLASCSPDAGAPSPPPAAEGTPAWPDLWARIQEQDPYPYSRPLPPAEKTAVDGTYGKLDPREGTRPLCMRCMPYPAEGGLWLLRLDKGVYRIFSTRSLSGWRSMGSFVISGNELVLFNDPHCMDVTGRYRWRLDSKALLLEAIEDECADGFRAITFTNYPWEIRTDS
jgi:hypothetical protein